MPLMNWKTHLPAAGLIALLPFSSCAVQVGGEPLVSAQSPAAAQSSHSEPQPPGSLPPGAEGLQSSGPNNTAPNLASVTVAKPAR
jgi:hypothetical protein